MSQPWKVGQKGIRPDGQQVTVVGVADDGSTDHVQVRLGNLTSSVWLHCSALSV